jgi:hypothetical protein
MIDRDILNSIPAPVAARSTFALLDRAQDLKPEAQLVATAALFLLLCERQGIDTQDVVTVTKNLMNAEGERHADFRAIADYMRYEL